MRFRAGALFLFLLLAFSTEGVAHTPDESEFLAANVTGEEVAIWLDGLDKRPNSIGIFTVHANPPLEQDYANVVETEVIKNIRGRGNTNVVQCPECRSPQVTVREDRLVISKGATDTEGFRQLGKKLGVETFLTLETYRTKMAVVTQATLYQTGSADAIAAERFRVPALNLGDAAMQFLLLGGPGVILAGKAPDYYGSGVSSGSSDIPFALDLLALEELGFGKGGLDLGGVFGGSSGTLGYLAPTLGFRGRFGSSAVTYLARFGAGFGLTGEAKGIAGRGGLDVFVGSFTVVGLDAVYFQPLKSNGDTLQGFAGIHVGFALGR